MDRYHAMRVFVRIAETGGFAEAARQLHMSPPAVTRAVAALEDLIGARLLTRTTRAVKLTEAGARYLEDCRHILAAIEEAEAAAAGSYATPTGVLTVTSSVLFGQIYIMPLMTEFLDLHPQVTGRMLLLDRVVNMVDEGVDVAIRIGHLPDSSYSAIRVGSVRRVICAAPDYIEARGLPQHPGDLADHRIIAATSAWTSLEWRFGAKAEIAVTVKPALFSNSNEAAIGAARSGWGLTRALSYQIGPDLIEGRLQIVLEDFEQPPLPVNIVHPDGRNASAKVRAFIDFARDRLRANRVFN
ncbi:LysR family transcriptional regulator [Erythrobacter donghaensis]|jgi:DNA-binding transcriptional LysR family regulator|uniref:LysR family transcriptional regulator n=2 Tax=Erythrobacter donghaensis TaxID=267135 RepID=UPI000833A563|nr:LysR family transcriptional regulator [Erythrobacter donghaensis]MBA4044913.1 LysR family transcriptional regulator [Erythrobacter sp.]MBA4079764.1 LysR family transcriptional regulator [Erythrobacter sp.]